MSTRAGQKSGNSKRTASHGGAGLKVRMYRVGFGDFFLVTVPTARGDRYILIDCGVFKGTSGTGDLGSIEAAVNDLYKTTGGKLALVIMTHRHADHISGFSRMAETFRKFDASMVWMPYWEKFNDPNDSAHNLQSDIEAMAMRLAMQFGSRTDEVARTALDQLGNATGIDFSAAGKEKKLSGNALALDLLKNHLGKNGANVRYYAAHDQPELPPELKGLKAEILGPPPKESKAFMKLTDFRKGVGQYLDSVSEDGTGNIRPFRPVWEDNERKEYPRPEQFGRARAIDYDEVKQMVDDAQPDMLAAAAAKIDTFLNNQSLVILFTFGGKRLLFVGDAQAGNWEEWLYDVDAPVNDPRKAGALTSEARQILGSIDFYKVGHHGSTNATPIAFVEEVRTSGRKFVAMCSTEPDVYGKEAKGTEVPRIPLMDAISSESALVRSDSIPVTVARRTIEPATEVPLPKPPTGKLRRTDLYVEYSF